MAFSPFRDNDVDAWVFGINGTSSFRVGDDYGWVTHPIQSLPKGYVFKGTYSASNGRYNPNHGKCVHFKPDGSVESPMTFTLERPEDGTEIEITISKLGKITEQ